MNHTVYFADKTVIFTTKTPGEEWYSFTAEDNEGISRAKITKILESHNKVALIVADPDEAFAAFKQELTPVEAAGGVVVNGRGEWLMIRRHGRWDLPKGHLEKGETLAECAVREIEEETGVRGSIVRPLCSTLHAYFFPKNQRWELKCTNWYKLNFISGKSLTPQIEEGIEQAVWCSPSEVTKNLKDAYPTIRCVAKAMGE